MSVCQVLTKNMETTSNITTERTEFREQLQRNREMNKEQRYAKDEKELKSYCRSVNVMGKGKKQRSQSLGARIALWKLGVVRQGVVLQGRYSLCTKCHLWLSRKGRESPASPTKCYPLLAEPSPKSPVLGASGPAVCRDTLLVPLSFPSPQWWRAEQKKMLQNRSETIMRPWSCTQGKQDPPNTGIQESDLGWAVKNKFHNDNNFTIP